MESVNGFIRLFRKAPNRNIAIIEGHEFVEKADIIIVNHSLLFSARFLAFHKTIDWIIDDFIIFDEAHEMPSEARTSRV